MHGVKCYPVNTEAQFPTLSCSSTPLSCCLQPLSKEYMFSDRTNKLNMSLSIFSSIVLVYLYIACSAKASEWT